MSGRVKKAPAPRKKANGYNKPPPIPVGEVITDAIAKKKWRIGPAIGSGGFGVIYSACEHESSPKKGITYPFVIKITTALNGQYYGKSMVKGLGKAVIYYPGEPILWKEPHDNGPLFVEKHFYIRNANRDDIANYMKTKKLTTFGMPLYFGNGSHEYKGEKFRYLVLERYGKDLWSIFKEAGRSFSPVTTFQIGAQMLDVLEYIHTKGYVHADIKGANILLGLKKGTENQAYLVDFGLATRVNEKEFKPDKKCAHNGTIEYTSRDAHLGVPTMRGDLEILGFNMLQWLIGELPWEKHLKSQETVQKMKESFMKNVKSEIKKQYPNVPDALTNFFEYINTLQPKDTIDYKKCRQIFENYLKSQGVKNNKLDFTKKKTNKKLDVTADESESTENKRSPRKKIANSKVPKSKQNAVEADDENGENEEPVSEVSHKPRKRKSIEPSVVVKLKKTKMTPKATPPAKKNHTHMATQTSIERRKRSPRQVSFDSPICEIIGDKNQLSANSSGDIFDDSFTLEGKKAKPKRKLLTDEKITVKRVVKKKVTTVKPKPKARSWKDLPTVVNGRSPPK